MFNIRKAGMLIILLALPAFFFLFLKVLGTNHYDLPRFHPLRDAAGSIVTDHGDTAYYAITSPLGLDIGGDTVDAGVLDDHFTFFLTEPPVKGSRYADAATRLFERVRRDEGVQFIAKGGSASWPEDVQGLIVIDSAVALAPGWDALLRLGAEKTEAELFRTKIHWYWWMRTVISAATMISVIPMTTTGLWRKLKYCNTKRK